MAPLTKTTIFPGQDPDPIISSPILKMIVLGDEPDIAAKSDSLAQNPPIIARAVIWYQSVPDDLQHIFSGLPADYSNIRAFSASTTNKVASLISIADEADFMILMVAFNEAGLPQFNT